MWRWKGRDGIMGVAVWAMAAAAAWPMGRLGIDCSSSNSRSNTNSRGSRAKGNVGPDNVFTPTLTDRSLTAEGEVVYTVILNHYFRH